MKSKEKTLSSERYRALYLSSGGAYFPSEVHRRAARIFLNSRYSKVLDIGCGFGQLVEILGKFGVDAIGCDYLNYKVLYPNLFPSWIQGRCIVADARSLPFCDQAFDGVACLGVLNYLSLDDLHLCLKECNRLLGQQGLLVIRTNGPLNRIGNMLRGFYYRKCVADSNYYSKALYLQTLQTTGFRIANFFYSLDTPPALSIRTLVKYAFYPFLSSLWIFARKV